MKRFTIHPPAGKEAPLGEKVKKRSLPEDIRVLNPLRVERVFVCFSDERLIDAIPCMKKILPWAEVKEVTPVDLSQRISNEHFVLIVDDFGAIYLNPQTFKDNHPGHAMVVLLSSDELIGHAPPHDTEEMRPHVRNAELAFYYDDRHPPESVIYSAVRCAEDRMNIESYSQAKRFIFLVVDDETLWFSEFLPVLYRMIGQRADILTARTYEEAEYALREYGDDIICLISDINIPRNKSMGTHGKDLTMMAKREFPRFPIIIASKDEEAQALADIGFVLPKGDEGALKELRMYVRDFTGLGDFFFYREGRFIGRASNLSELRDLIATLPSDMLDRYAERDYFSTWLYMHGFQKLADELRPMRNRGEELRDVLLESFGRKLEEVSREPFVFLDENGIEVSSVSSLEELADCIRTMDIKTLEFYAHIDGFSTWLMRKGHSRLADRLRPFHASGEELRASILGFVEQETGGDR